MRYRAYVEAARMDGQLGDPENDGRVFSYARCAALDEAEEFPLEICRELDALSMPRHYVPAEYGGALRGYDDTMQLVRVMARRDLTVAIAHGKTFLGAVCVWVSGDAGQARRLGAEIADGAVVSWALTEREHGSDLLAGQVSAEQAAGGYRLTGEKWLINNATRCHLLSVLARTSGQGGPRGFSVLLVDRRALGAAGHHPLPAVRLHGIRGADISGIAFRGAPIPASALVGTVGTGLETVVKSLQLTRTLCAGLSLGAADQALGMAIRHAREDRGAIELSRTRRLLTGGYADLLLAEAVSMVAGRSVHTLTGELPVSSAVVKYFVPTLVHRMLSRLAQVMGARSVLVGGADRDHGRFQKVQRDHRIVGIFDGSTMVNLHSLVNQFSGLVRGYQRAKVDEAGLRSATTLGEPPPDFDRARLRLVSQHGSSLVQSLPAAAEELRDLTADGEACAGLARLAGAVCARAEDVIGQMAAYRPTATGAPAAALALTERYAELYAAAAAIQLWLRNRMSLTGTQAEELWASGLWLEACLHRVLSPPGRAGADEAAEDVLDRLAGPLLTQHASGQLLSLLPYPPTGGAR
jgi:alkylation response protein AidB-like acyl-CoA dehydrogenase